MDVQETIFYKYSPLWYSTMSMKAFSNGDYKLAEQYYDQGQEILKITGSIYLPLTHYNLEITEILSLPDASKDYANDNKKLV